MQLKHYSSLQFSSQTLLDREEIRNITQLLNALYENPDSIDFRDPVDYINLNLPDYLQIVKRPMDLGTIKKKLKQGQYNFVEEILNDIQLIWDNCKIYNVDGSQIVKYAKANEKYMRKCIKQFLPNINAIYQQQSNSLENQNSTFASKYISKQEKEQFLEQIKFLNKQQLGQIVVMIVQNCHEAYKEVENNRCMILIDVIRKDFFNEIQQQLQLFGVGDEQSSAETSKKKVKLQ